MRLAYIVNNIAGAGGLERVLSIKASYLADTMGYNVHIITLNQKTTELFYQFSSNITFHNFIAFGNPVTYFLKYRKDLKNILLAIQPNVVSVCDDGLKGLFVPLIIGKQYPMVYERHVSKNASFQLHKNSIFGKLKNKLISGLMNVGGSFYHKFVVLTNGNLNEWNLKNAIVISNPLSFYPDQQSKLENKKVLAVGKQSFQKGYDRLLKAWQLVHNKFPDWELNIYGTISKEQGLDDLARQLEISKSVNFYAPVKNIQEKYKETAIYVMSSRYEGFGMVLIEAMAYGVPCVSFDCPYGPSDIINHEKDGILVENGDIEGLANGILELIDDIDKRKAMGNIARQAVACYHIKNIAIQWDSMFNSLINN